MDIHILLVLCVGVLTKETVFGVEPSFDVPVINVTVHEGDTAILPCSVEHLGDHKVVWTDQWSTLLTLDDRRIIDDTRISIERPKTRDWNLHIRHALYSDRGQYICQINTKPVKTKTVMLIVKVPSKIIDELSSRDQTVREGDTVTLVCNVTGVPTPEVKWFKLPSYGSMNAEKQRLDLEPGIFTTMGVCAYTLQQTEIGNTGEVLLIHNVSRYCDGTYACVAFNEVEPAVTRTIQVFVEFPPEVTIPQKRLGQVLGRQTILDCEVSAYPHGVTVWKRNGVTINQNQKSKYSVELYSGNEESTKRTLSLRVLNIQHEDFGEYTCYAQNSLGEDNEKLLLYHYTESVKQPTTQRSLIIEPNSSEKSNTVTLRPTMIYPKWSDIDRVIPTRPRGDGPNPYYPPEKGSVALSSTGSASRNSMNLSAVLFVICLVLLVFVLKIVYILLTR